MSGRAVTGDHAIVLLHPLGGNANCWTILSKGLEPYRCLAINLAGFGGNASDKYSCENMANAVAAEIAKLDATTFTLVGHSMGGKIATILTHYAESGHSNLRGLTGVVLIAASPPSPEPIPDDMRTKMLGWTYGQDQIAPEHADTFIDDNTHSDLNAQKRDAMKASILQSNPDAWAAWLNTGSRQDWSQKVGKLYTRCLIIAGRQDGPLGVEGQETLNIPVYDNSTLKVIEDAAHLISLEQPAALAELITDFVNVSLQSAEIAEQYHALINRPRTSARTRAIHLERLTAPIPDLLGEKDRKTLAKLCDLILPQPADISIDLTARVETAVGESDGWRFADLPADEVAFVQGLKCLNDIALDQKEAAFVGLAEGDQIALLSGIEDDSIQYSTPLNMTRWFEDLRAITATAYISHPAAMARVGYDGFANGGDGARLDGYEQTVADRIENWALPAHTGDGE